MRGVAAAEGAWCEVVVYVRLAGPDAEGVDTKALSETLLRQRAPAGPLLPNNAAFREAKETSQAWTRDWALVQRHIGVCRC